MKRSVALILAICIAAVFSGCGSKPGPASSAQGKVSESMNTEAEKQESKILVAFFSCTGNTEAVAEKISELSGGVLYEITPSEPYSSADINYSDTDCRANREMNDAAARPQIAGNDIDISRYDVVFIGFPIWWGTMPRIINTFVEKYDFSEKTVIPFCTSGGSGISKAVSDLKAAMSNADIKEGLRASGAADQALENWVGSILQ